MIVLLHSSLHRLITCYTFKQTFVPFKLSIPSTGKCNTCSLLVVLEARVSELETQLCTVEIELGLTLDGNKSVAAVVSKASIASGPLT